MRVMEVCFVLWLSQRAIDSKGKLKNYSSVV